MHKNKVKGFTLIELMIVVAIIGILSSLVVGALGGSSLTSGTLCKGGYLFSVDYNGNQQQMINAQGTAVGCS